MQIQFEATNLLASMVGDQNGVTPDEVAANRVRALDALAGFRKQSEAGLYGFPHLPFADQVVAEVQSFAQSVRGSYETVCLVGIGGSALGAWALDCGLRGPHPVQGAFSTSHPRLVILDNVDPEFVGAALDSMDPRKTLVVAAAKSGGTAETVATLLTVREWIGRSEAIVAVTTQGRGDLWSLAGQEKYRTFAIPENVGGRFSVLSPVGLLPAALIGVNIGDLVAGAAEMTHACWQPDLEANTALRAALYHYLIWTRKQKTIQVAFPYSNRLWGTAFWFRQLWAESLGKARDRQGKTLHVGQTPVAALGTTDQHSQVQLYIEGPNDKVFTFWAVAEPSRAGSIPSVKLNLPAFDALAGRSLAQLLDAERRSTAAALAANGRPSCTFTLQKLDERHLGAFLQLMEFETAFMGELLDINAFDQEGVELGKRFTYGLMGRSGYDEYRSRFEEYERRRRVAES